MPLYFDCNTGCGTKIRVDVSDWSQIPLTDNGRYPLRAVHSWLGKQVLDALLQHHKAHCTEYNKRPNGRPDLRLIVTEAN